MRIKTLIILIVLITNYTYSQSQNIFQKAILPQSGLCGIIKDGGGGFTIAGGTSAGPLYPNCGYIVRLNNNADTIWTKFYALPTGCRFSSITKTIENGYIIGGHDHNDYKNFILAIDSNGQTKFFRKCYPLNMQDRMVVKQASDSGLIIGYSVYNSADYDFCIMKTNKTGNVLWAKNYGTVATDGCRDICLTSDNGIVLAGTSGNNLMILKTDSIGNFKWKKEFSANYISNAASVVTVADNIYLAGLFGYPENGFVTKLDSSGNIQWTKSYDFLSCNNFSIDIERTNDNNLILCHATGCGFTTSDACLVKMNLNGDTIWTRGYGNTPQGQIFEYVYQDSLGYYFGIGNGTTMPSQSAIIIVKSDSLGISNCYMHYPSIPLGNTSFGHPNSILNYGSINIVDYAFNLIEISNAYNESDYCIYTNIAEAENHEIESRIFPNPVSDMISFNKENLNIEIFDLKAQKLFERKTLGKQIDISQLAKGFYFLKVKETGTEKTFKIIKQ